MSELVDIIVSGYEWICPSCESLNKICEYPCDQKLKCEICGEEFVAALPEHALSG